MQSLHFVQLILLLYTLCYDLIMFINKETDYAIRIVRNLNHESLSQLDRIAERENISLPMAKKVVRELKNSGLVKSKSGINGGYYLTKPLHELFLLDIYGIMNNHTDINKCLADENLCPFSSTGACKVHKELIRIQEVIHEELKSTPLSELA